MPSPIILASCIIISFLILVWMAWRLCKNQDRFANIEKQLQYIFKKLDDLMKS